MKELLTVVTLLLSGVVAEPPAPYAPSGWRPNGPSFELPARPSAQVPQKQEYLPPVDPRRPARPTEFDDVDVSVQGLPTAEQQPIFQLSPISGQQYAGPNFQADIRNLDQTLQQVQYQQQLEKQREFARQRQLDAARSNFNANGLPNPQTPRQFVPQTTTTTTQRPEFRTEATTESDLNEGEEYDDDKNSDDAQNAKVSVEVTKQNIQEYPPELFLRPLTQFKIQPQFVQLQQLDQLRAPLYYQPLQQEPEKQNAEGFDGPAHFAALPSVLAQQQLLAQAQPQPQPQPAFNQNPAFVIARGQEQPASAYAVPALQEPISQYQPVLNNQYQPLLQPQVQPLLQPQGQPLLQPQVQPQVQAYPQFQAQPVILPAQSSNQLQPNQYAQPAQPESDAEEVETVQNQPQQPQPQFVYQQAYQPQEVYQQPFPAQPQEVYQQPFPAQPQEVYQQPFSAQPQVNQFQPQDQQNLFYSQPQLVNYPAQDLNQYYQSQLYQQQFADPNQVQIAQQNQIPQQNFQGQEPLQSGLDINQDNGIDQKEETDDEREDEANEGSRATAVATAFGARTQPRVFAQYGAPAPRPQANPGYPSTTEASQEEAVTEEVPAIAQATAVATGSRKSAKLRSRRIRPVFTLDRSGHLVLSRDQ